MINEKTNFTRGGGPQSRERDDHSPVISLFDLKQDIFFLGVFFRLRSRRRIDRQFRAVIKRTVSNLLHTFGNHHGR